MRGHTNAWEVTGMAQTFLDLGFRVEVCDYDDEGVSSAGGLQGGGSNKMLKN